MLQQVPEEPGRNVLNVPGYGVNAISAGAVPGHEPPDQSR